jgi:hypothetical protein
MKSERLQKLFTSPVFLFLYYSVLFGTVIQLVSNGNRPFSWAFAAIIGVPAGLIMTAISLRQLKKSGKAIGLTDPAKQRTVQAALKTGKLPDDPQVRKALPAFLEKSLKATEKIRKYGMAFIVAVGASSLLLAIGNRNSLQIAMWVVFMLAGFVIYVSTQKTRIRIDELHRQLKIKPEIATTAPPVAADITKETLKTFFRFISGYIGIVAVIEGAIVCSVNSSLVLELGLPLIGVGLLLLTPYYLLRGRWVNAYAVLLVLAVIFAVYSLNTPVGSKMIVPAHIALPDEPYGPSAFVAWATLHSAPLLAAVGILRLLDIARSKRPFSSDKGEWKVFFIFVALAAFLTVPFGSPASSRKVQPDGSTSGKPSVGSGKDIRIDQPVNGGDVQIEDNSSNQGITIDGAASDEGTGGVQGGASEWDSPVYNVEDE